MSIYRAGVIFAALFLLSFQGQKQDNYPQHYFHPPIDGPLHISGTFGELRPHHFHAGLDIKGKTGQAMRAAAAGYVARIKVSAGGYGKVLYINHPNGFTTIYAHLDGFSPGIEDFVKAEQYRQHCFEVDLKPAPERFPVSKGTKIGALGTTGRSFGPHVHFEIRDTRSGQPVNPLLFGLPVKDHRPPSMEAIKTYAVDQKGNALPQHTYLLRGNQGHYRIGQGDTLLTTAPRTAFALNTIDRLDGAANRNGVYEIYLFENGQAKFHTKMETFHASHSRYLNAHLDYETWQDQGDYFHRCFRLPGNKLEYIYPKDEGVIKLKKGQKKQIGLMAKDHAGNESLLQFWIKRTDGKVNVKRPLYHYFLPQDEANGINALGLQLRFPKNAFYQDTYFSYTISEEESWQIFSTIHHLHTPKIPVHHHFELALKPHLPIPDSLLSRAFIAYCNDSQEIVNCGGSWKSGWLYTQTRTLGDYFITVDDQPPAIEPISFRRDMRGHTTLSFRITDNIKSSGKVKALDYRAFIDGQWVLFTYDAKSGLLEHQFEPALSQGEHTLLLEVFDAVGNITQFKQDFIR